MMSKFKEIEACRASGNKNLLTVLNLGMQELTGVFPKNIYDHPSSGPLELVWCSESGLLQLKHSFDAAEMYGENYGYRSGLNQSMVEHLTNKVRYLERLVGPSEGDLVLDIGSNDCTLLKSYSTHGLERMGIDPTGRKFAEFYPSNILLSPEFFSVETFRSATSKQAKIVTSIAMFYDLDNPVEFAQNVASILTDDGIWHFEQSYMPSMLRCNSYDTICHEHLEYYSLGAIIKILAQADLKVVDVSMNNINGGSFAVTAAKLANKCARQNKSVINWLLEQEYRMGINTPKPFREFEERVFNHKDALVRLIRTLRDDGKKIFGYGASTKGNVTLQFCGLNSTDITAIADVNPDKYGHFTPGTYIPIISESKAKEMNPDYFLVLPWHFKDSILRRERKFLEEGGKFIFPFPEIEIVQS